MNKSEYGMPEASPWKQKPKKLSRLARSLSFNTQHENKIKPDMYFDDDKENLVSSSVERKRKKRQFLFGSTAKLAEDIAELNERLDGIEKSMNRHFNLTVNKTASTAPDVSALWKNLTESRERQAELEKRVDDLERRLQVTELTTAEIAEEMAQTRSYLDHLKANMSEGVEETISNDTIVKVITEDGKEQLPPSKDLKAFQNYLKDIGEITREDFQELGIQKEDFIASCTWQGTICDSR